MDQIQEEVIRDLSETINSNIDLSGLNEKQESILIQSIFIVISLLASILMAYCLRT